MTRRKQLQDMVKRMKEDREKLSKGCTWDELGNIVHLFSDAPGTRFSGIDRTIKNLEDRLAQAERDLAALPKSSALEEAKYTYEYCSATNETAKAYIAALEACRPWVIKSKSTGVLARRIVSGDIALYSTKEIAVKDCEDTGRTREWEVVQWEGNQ